MLRHASVLLDKPLDLLESRNDPLFFCGATAGRRGPREITTYAEPHDDVWLVVTVLVTVRARRGRAS